MSFAFIGHSVGGGAEYQKLHINFFEKNATTKQKLLKFPPGHLLPCCDAAVGYGRGDQQVFIFFFNSNQRETYFTSFDSGRADDFSAEFVALASVCATDRLLS